MILLLNIEHLFIDGIFQLFKSISISMWSVEISFHHYAYILFLLFILYMHIFLIYCSEVSFTPSPYSFPVTVLPVTIHNPLCLPVNTLMFYLQ